MDSIGKTILSQLTTLAPTDLMCWGARTFRLVNESQLVPNHMGGLLFTVSGMLHKGVVLIVLEASDTYTVRIGRMTKGKFVQKGDSIPNVYFDELNVAVCSMVEGYHKFGKSIYQTA